MKNSIELFILICLSCLILTVSTFSSNSSNIEAQLSNINIPNVGEKTKASDIKDKYEINGNYYSECDSLKTSLIVLTNGDNLELQFELKNISNEDIIITYDSRLYDILMYNENDSEVYRLSSESDYTPAIMDKTIPNNKNLIIEDSIDLSDRSFVDGTYEIVFTCSFAINSENKKYSLSEKAYINLSSKE